MKRIIIKKMFYYSILYLLISVFSVTYAQGNLVQKDNSTKKSNTSDNKSLDLKKLEVCLDDFFKQKMESRHIPGAVFVLVKDGKIIFHKGYGYSDVEKKINVKPDETIFRVGSVSKIFTATAAMQLNEKGKIDIHADVNKYLSLFKLENNYPEPVTMANLLSHTAGFRGRSIGSMTQNESNRIPLGEFLASNMPGRSLPPGRIINYSNHGFQLAGYLVEVVSGIPFAQYIDDNILHPLGMDKSSFIPLPRLLTYMAKGYSYADGGYNDVPNDYSLSLISPSGSLLSTADDMARFMIAQLQGGIFQDQRILNENTCNEMQKRQFTNDPRLPGTCYGFYEYQNYNKRAIFLDGDVTGFSSRMFLLPDQNTGFFVCSNSENSRLRMQLTDTLMSHFFSDPEKPVTANPVAGSKSNLTLLAGNYRNLRIGLDYFDKFEEASALLTLSDKDISGWIELEPFLFQLPNSKTRLLFKQNNEGKVTNLFIDSQQMPVSYERAEWYDTEMFIWIPYGFFSFVFLSSCVIWLFMYYIQRKRKPLVENCRPARQVRMLLIFTVVLNFIFIASLAPSVYLFKDDFQFGMPIIIKILLVIPIVTTILTIGLSAFSLSVWKNKYWNLKARLHYSLITLTCIGFILWLYHWNWLGFQY